jgi:hypothetical protein
MTQVGNWQPRQARRLPKPIDQLAQFIELRGREVGWNGVVLHRELSELGFGGSYQQVQHFLEPPGALRRWSELAPVRFETLPGYLGSI